MSNEASKIINDNTWLNSSVLHGNRWGILRKNRFICTINTNNANGTGAKIDENIFRFNIISANLPKISFSSKDTTIYGYPRRYIEERDQSTFQISFYDDSKLTIRRMIYDWMQRIYNQKKIKRDYISNHEASKLTIAPITADVNTLAYDVFEYVFPLEINSIDYDVAADNEYIKTDVVFSYRFHEVVLISEEASRSAEETGTSVKRSGSVEPGHSSQEELGSDVDEPADNGEIYSDDDPGYEDPEDDNEEDVDPDEISNEMEDELENDKNELENEMDEEDEEITDDEEELEDELDEDNEDIADCACSPVSAEPTPKVPEPETPKRIPTVQETDAVYDEYDGYRATLQSNYDTKVTEINNDYDPRIKSATDSGNTKLAATLTKNKNTSLTNASNKLMADKESIFKQEQYAIDDLSKVQ